MEINAFRHCCEAAFLSILLNGSCFVIKVLIPNLVFIRVGLVVSVNLCAKYWKKENLFIRKGENYAIFLQTFLYDFVFNVVKNTNAVVLNFLLKELFESFIK